MDKKTSLIILIPAGIGSVIEIWKVTKAVKLRITFQSWKPQIHLDASSDKEKTTETYDQEVKAFYLLCVFAVIMKYIFFQAIKYLSYLLYPLLICGALYSLFYMPHQR